MICPKCESKMKVVATKEYGTQETDSWERLRVYECPDCKYRLKSSEIIIAEGVKYRNLD